MNVQPIDMKDTTNEFGVHGKRKRSCSSDTTANRVDFGVASSLVNTKKYHLPKDFEPSDKDVLIGRGKKCYNHVGNLELRKIVVCKMEDYSTAKCKIEKSNIISSIVTEVRSNGGNFVKENSPESSDGNETATSSRRRCISIDDADCKWYDVGDNIAREKIAQTFRDALHSQYRSSTHFKKKRRQERRRIKAAAYQAESARVSNLVEFMYRQQFDSAGIHNSNNSRHTSRFIVHQNRAMHAGTNIQVQPFNNSSFQSYMFNNNVMNRQTKPNAHQMNINKNSSTDLQHKTAPDTSSFSYFKKSEDILSVLSSSLPDGCFEDENPFEPVPISTSSPDTTTKVIKMSSKNISEKSNDLKPHSNLTDLESNYSFTDFWAPPSYYTSLSK